MGKSADKLGKELEAGINARPHVGGGYIQRAQHVPHENKLYVDTQHVQRDAVLRHNAELRKNLGRRDPDHLGGDMMFSVPVDDWEQMLKDNPDYNFMDRRQKRRFWNKQRRLHPEWFIG